MKTYKLLLIFISCFMQHAISQTATGSFTQIPCNNDGVFSVSTTGLNPPLTFSYYTDEGVITHTNVNSTSDDLTNIAMNFSVSVYCQVTDGVNTVYTQGSFSPSFIFTTSASDAICPSTTGTVSATYLSGTQGPFSFNWTNTQTLVSYPGNNISVPSGVYNLQVTDQTTGCVLLLGDSGLTYVNQISPVTASISTTAASCTNGSATAVASGGIAPYTYLWSSGSTSSTVSGLSAGSYSLIVTDAQGCYSNNLYAYIQQNPTISINTTINNATCVQNDGSAMAFGTGGTAPYSYSWSNGQTGNTATNLSGGTSYTVVSTDANACIGQRSIYIPISTPISVTYTSTPSLCTAPTGTATLTATGGTPPYTYTWYTNPLSSGASLNNVASGTYSFEVTDAVGCIRTGNAVISPISTISANVQASNVFCPNTTGTVTAAVSGSNPPFSYLWSNGATTSQINSAPLGNYSCQITDSFGCSVTKFAHLTSSSPINLGVSTTNVSCIFDTDGTATPLVSGGLAPYSYLYSNGTTTPNATGLAMGNYSLKVTDDNGCSRTRNFWINNANTSTSCYCTISGNVYLDVNSNCNYDLGETGIEKIRVYCSGYGSTFTDANGYYRFQVPSGTYTISEQNHPYYPLASCQNNIVSVTVVAAANCNTVVDFANDINVVNDLKIVTLSSNLPPIPGNNYQQRVIVTNEGSVAETGIQLSYEHDGQLPFVSSSLPSFTQLNPAVAPNNYSVQSGFPVLNPNQSSVVLLNYNTPTNIPLGTTIEYKDSVANAAPIDVNWLLDETPWNNVNAYQTSVIGSYDPNYKEVSPKGEGAEGFITYEVSEFDYTIHFQNEGTYFAQNIYITDQLDEDLDWSSFKPGYSDHSYTTRVNETGLVTFTFENINLPWKSQYGDALSSGLINYSIKRKTDNLPGTEFTNEANIYFDYNEPIKTNTTLNTLADTTTSIIDRKGGNSISDASTVDLFPVPTKDIVNIRINNIAQNSNAQLRVIDIMGKVVLVGELSLELGTSVTSLDISKLVKGTYFTQIQFDDGSYIVKKTVLY